MTLARSLALIGIALSTSGLCVAQQQKFPLRPGDWEVGTTMPSATQPIVFRVCLNDELWTQALSNNPDCSVLDLNVTPKGASYRMDCSTKSYTMKGTVQLNFDGKEHISGKGFVNLTQDGKISNVSTTVDYRWKGADCNANDVNLKQRKMP
jgi:hypothetical protein